MRRIGEPVLKALVYLCAWFSWAACMLLIVMLLDLLLKGHFEKYWLPITLVIFGAAVLLANLSRDFVKQGILKVVSLFHPTPPGDIVEITTGPLMVKELTAMAGNEKFVINNPGTVNIQDKSTSHVTHNNVQGGIIGSGTVHVHQHIEAREAEAQTLQEKPTAGVPGTVADNDTIDINELLTFAEKLMQRPVARNTIVKILERGNIESCGEVKVDKTWSNVYPRACSKEAVEKWAADKAK